MVQNQISFDERVKKLVKDIVMAFYIAKDASHIHQQIDSFSHVVNELLNFLVMCCIHIRTYCLRSFTGKMTNWIVYRFSILY